MEKKPAILVVEDDAGMRETLSDILADKGYVVKPVGTGKEALALAKKEKFPTCLIDLKLPDITGIEVLKGLKALNPEAYAIIITAYASKETAIEALKADAYCYIEKPVNIEELLAAVERASEAYQSLEDKRRAEEELIETRDYLDNIIASSADAIVVVDMNGIVRDWNKSAEGIMGYRADEVIGASNRRFFADPEEPDRIMERVQREGMIKNYRTIVLRKDGKPVHISMSAALLKDKNGVPIGTVRVSRDITEQKRAEEEREKLLKELEAKNTEMERFTYVVSHDLRSPLVTTQGFVSVLREDLEQNEIEKVENDLKYIETSVKKMDHLLSDTLQLSRIGHVVNPPEDVPFGELVQEAQEQTAEQIKSSGVEISVAEDFPAVHVDRIRIVEVLVNLIGNSMNYMGEQPRPKIDVGYRVDGEETVFFVKDNGIGIDKSQHGKVFELFYKLDRTGKGTGAGLAIVKRIIEVHGGRIWIESEKGKGCAVCFTLPVT